MMNQRIADLARSLMDAVKDEPAPVVHGIGVYLSCWVDRILIAQGLEIFLRTNRTSLPDETVSAYLKIIDHERQQAASHYNSAKEHYPEADFSEIITRLTGDPFFAD